MVRSISGLDRLRTLVHSFGPAWVVMIADVDAASILTAAADGALYGYSLVWLRRRLRAAAGANVTSCQLGS
jgi:Mn2+/Fe2+ NRAMP family transporter